jgi:hypothetical protein
LRAIALNLSQKGKKCAFNVEMNPVERKKYYAKRLTGVKKPPKK